MDDFWWVAGVIFCGIFIIVGSIGNGLTIGVFIKFSHFQNPLGCLILSLAVVDFLNSCFIIPFNLMYFRHAGTWQYSFELCRLHKIFGYGMLMHAAILISLIAVNRYVQVCYTSQQYKKLFSNWKVFAMSLIALGYSFFIMILINFEVGGGGIKLYAGKCFIDFGGLIYPIVTTIAILSVVITAAYSNIYFKVLRSRRNAHGESLQVSQVVDEANMRLLRMVTVITVAYVICFVVPFAILAVFQSTSKIVQSAVAFIYQIPILASVCTNPIIYVVMNTQYSNAYYELITGMLKKLGLRIKTSTTTGNITN